MINERRLAPLITNRPDGRPLQKSTANAKQVWRDKLLPAGAGTPPLTKKPHIRRRAGMQCATGSYRVS
jgi:hypothetical protein